MNGLAIRVVAENRKDLANWINSKKRTNFVGELIPVDIVNGRHDVEVINLNVSAVTAILNEMPPGPKPAPGIMPGGGGLPPGLAEILEAAKGQGAEGAEPEGITVIEVPAAEPDDGKGP
jgi:hypothetical protein